MPQLARFEELSFCSGGNQRDIIEEQNQFYWDICFFGDKIINTFSIESSKLGQR